KADYFMIVGMPALALVLARRLAAIRRVGIALAMPAMALAALAGALVFMARHPLYAAPPHAQALVAAGAAALVAAATAFTVRHVRAGSVALGAFAVVLALLYSGFL